MKKYFFLVLAFVTVDAFALEAVVTVLESPMFQYRSLDAPVVQYLRKGDIIKIHPSIGNDPKWNKYAPTPEKLAEVQKRLKEISVGSEDKMFKGDQENTFYVTDQFIPMLDRQGHTVYVLSEHILVYFNDQRELDQVVPRHDLTDYRLEEPLARNYPLPQKTGYRGQFLVGVTQPYFESYPYSDGFKTKGFTTPLDLNLTFLKKAPGNYADRLFLGGTINHRRFENTYTFPDRKFSHERWNRLGIGPAISYDAYKGEKNRINISSTILVNLIDQLSISQSRDSTSDSRRYMGYSIVPRIALQYHRKQVLEDLDFILGTSMEMVTPTTFNAKDGGKQPGWWQELGSDKFSTRTTFSLGAYLGIQSAY